MTAQPQQSGSAKVFEVFWNLLLIVIGSILAAISINGILIPNGFVTGGLTGIALIIHHLLPRFSFGLIYLL
ncbi:MAG: YitT family protein, partial [Desulfobulbaceae bacterium]|nr:YitT family protein [Desulfobulbaceae bacterium]